MSFRSSGIRCSSSSTCGFQIWNVSPVPRNRARSPIWPLRRIFGRRERHQVALLIFELRLGVGLFFFEQPLELRVLQRGIGGVVGAEAGKGFVLGKDDGSGVAAALD